MDYMGSCKQFEHRRIGELWVDACEDLKQAADFHDAQVNCGRGENRTVETEIKANRYHCIHHDRNDHEAKLGHLVADALSHLLALELMLHACIADAEDPIQEDQDQQGGNGNLCRKAITDGGDEGFE